MHAFHKEDFVQAIKSVQTLLNVHFLSAICIPSIRYAVFACCGLGYPGDVGNHTARGIFPFTPCQYDSDLLKGKGGPFRLIPCG